MKLRRSLVLLAGVIALIAGCGGGGDRRERDLGTTALCNNDTFSFETDCSEICRGPDQGGVKQWYVDCGQEGTGPTSPMR